jgi:hydrogenase expression/formation protein HypE
VGLHVERDRIPVLPEGRRLCDAFGLDPLGTIASGALLLAVDPAAAGAVIAACEGSAIACRAIGRVTERAAGATGGDPMPVFPQDEISRLFAEG